MMFDESDGILNLIGALALTALTLIMNDNKNIFVLMKHTLLGRFSDTNDRCPPARDAIKRSLAGAI